MANKRIVLAGGSGFLGQSLAKELLLRGYEVVVLTRSPQRHAGGLRDVPWDGKTYGDWAQTLEGAEAVVNLTGKNVNCRYTPENRREIVASRVDSVNVIAEAIARCRVSPKVLVQAATLAIYGDAGADICDESASPGRGFSVETCLSWERAFNSTETPHTRKVLLRIGFALGRDGGALKTLARLTKLGLGGTVGSGEQYISWIHTHDLKEMFLASIVREDIIGVFNATSPQPVTNARFMRSLRRALHRPWSPPVPAWAVRIGARLMNTEAELALTGRRCIPKRFTEKDFKFKYPDLDGALTELFA